MGNGHYFGDPNLYDLVRFDCTYTCTCIPSLLSLMKRVFQETRVTSLRDILEKGVRDGKLKPSHLKILDDL